MQDIDGRTAMAFVGAVLIGGANFILFLLAAVLGAITTAASSVVAKALPEVHPVNMNAIGMGSGALLLATGSVVFGETWSAPGDMQTWMAVAWLVIFGSLGLFQLFLYVIKRLTASATVYAVTAMPLIAVVLGALLLEQPITIEVLVGGALVLSAVYVGAILTRRRPIPQ